MEGQINVFPRPLHNLPTALIIFHNVGAHLSAPLSSGRGILLIGFVPLRPSTTIVSISPVYHSAHLSVPRGSAAPSSGSSLP